MNATITNVPNKAFDSEYNTQFKKEMLYLKDRGIEPVYIKKSGEYRIPTYKYTKTPELFRAVADFYEQQKRVKEFENMKKTVDAVSFIVNGVAESGVADGHTAD